MNSIEALKRQTASKAVRKSKVQWKKNMPLLIMILPGFLYYFIFKYVPMGGLVIAFKNYNLFDGVWGSPWVGWGNFELLFKQANIVAVIRNTLLLSTLNIVFGFPFPIILAILLNEARRLWFKKVIQTLVYLPHFLSWIIIGGFIVTIFSMESGTLNHWITAWFGEPYPFMYQVASWTAIYVGSGIWKEAGFGAIIYLAALTNIDPSLYESASIDGAGKLRQIWNVTLPGIMSTVVIMFILKVGQAIDVGFDQVYVLKNAVVSNVAEVISTYIYRAGFQGGQFALTTALGFFESLVGLILVVAANWIARRFNQGLW
jgi:putative aldouronate transport system permease protein